MGGFIVKQVVCIHTSIFSYSHVRIVAMSDLHVGTLISRQWLEARVAQVKAQRPDLVVLPGDIFEGHDQLKEEMISVLRLSLI